MRERIDRRVITDDFLITYFPSPERYNEMCKAYSTLAVSEERYLIFRKELNEKRRKSGKGPWSDMDIFEFITLSEGYLQLSRSLKPNQHL